MSTESVRAALENPEPVEPMAEGPLPRTPEDRGSGLPPDDPEPPVRKASRQTENDVGNAQRFVIHFGEDVMFVPRVGWFTWEGKVWAADPDELEVRRRAQKIGPLMLQELDFLRLPEHEMELILEEQEVLPRCRDLAAVPAKDRSEEQKAEYRDLQIKLDRIGEAKERLTKRRDRRRGYSKTAGNSGPIKNMLVESQTSLAVALEDLDADPWVINCESGVLRSTLREEREGDRVHRYAGLDVLPHERGQRLTKIMPVTYDPEAEAEKFHAFLNRVLPDPAIRAFLQRWFGVSMTAEPLQNMVFLYGSGANGKSVLVDTMARILGDYAATARIESLTGTNRRGGGEATPDLMPLIGSRMVRTSEPDEGAKLQEGMIKELTGGEAIMVRALHADFIEVRPVFKLLMSGNHKPDIRGTDDGIWRRFLMVPFDVQIPIEERDPHLVDKLWAERDGIFRWALEGLAMFREQGLAPPAAVMEATADFRAEQDPVGDFLSSCTLVTGDPAHTMPSARLNEAFRYWQVRNGTGTWNPTTVSRRLSEKADRWRHPNGGGTFSKRKASTVYFDGIRLTDVFERDLDAAPRTQRGDFIAEKGATPHPDEGGSREGWED